MRSRIMSTSPQLDGKARGHEFEASFEPQLDDQDAERARHVASLTAVGAIAPQPHMTRKSGLSRRMSSHCADWFCMSGAGLIEATSNFGWIGAFWAFPTRAVVTAIRTSGKVFTSAISANHYCP